MDTGYTYVIGMDMGTTNIKAIVLRSDGAVVAEESLPSTHYNPGLNMQEQDAEEWWEHVCTILQSVTKQIGPEEARRSAGSASVPIRFPCCRSMRMEGPSTGL